MCYKEHIYEAVGYPPNMGIVTRAVQILNEDGPIRLARSATSFVTRKVRTQIYSFGSSRICPLCGFSGMKFMSAGIQSRPNAACPNCGAKERHRLLWRYLENETDILQKEGRLLYFAPADSMENGLKKSNKNIVTTDLLMDGVDIRSDITDLPFKDGVFDTIICSHVLEHILDDYTAISELVRVLDSKGDAIIMVPKDKNRDQTYEDSSINTPEIRREEFGQEDHVRWYGRDFEDRLVNADFKVIVETYARKLPEKDVVQFGLSVNSPDSKQAKYEDIHHCRISK